MLTFANTYEDLYSRKNEERKDEEDSEARLENTDDHADDSNTEDNEQDRHVPEFTVKEKGKSAVSKGIKAEDLKGADKDTTKMTHEIFNMIMKNSISPSSWKKVMVTVIYKTKKITGRSVPFHNFFKLFSTMKNNKL